MKSQFSTNDVIFKRGNVPLYQLVVSAQRKRNMIENILDSAYLPLKPCHSSSPALYIASMCTVYSDLSGSLGARPIRQAGDLSPKVLKKKPATVWRDGTAECHPAHSEGIEPRTQPWAHPGGLKSLSITAPSLHTDVLALFIPAQGYCIT